MVITLKLMVAATEDTDHGTNLSLNLVKVYHVNTSISFY